MQAILDYIADPERRAAAAAFQDEQRAKLGHRVIKDPVKANYFYGVARERFVVEQLRALNEHAHGLDDEALTARRKELFEQLAEGMALQGKFEEAAIYAFDAQKEAEYKEKAIAVSMLGTKRCDCPPFVMKPSKSSAKGERVETAYPIQDVFDGTHAMTLTRCGVCRTISAR